MIKGVRFINGQYRVRSGSHTSYHRSIESAIRMLSLHRKIKHEPDKLQKLIGQTKIYYENPNPKRSRL